MRRELLIIGLGLIGGSAGIALRRRGWRVRYIDNRVNVDDARRCEAADERADAIGTDDFVLLATPVDAAVALLPAIRGTATSVCSVMQPLREIAACHPERSEGPGRAGHDAGSSQHHPGPSSLAPARDDRFRFVAGHPMAGSHERGLAAARGDLFEGKRWFLDGHDDDVEHLVRDCGAVADFVDAKEHDRAVAVTSHLPQILSTALAAYLGEHEDMLRFAGSGLATFLRLAGSDAEVWRPVIEANRANLVPHAEEVVRIAREIVEGDPTDAFERAQKLWRKL
jgi:prephenate dehydrogenase